MRLVKCFIYSEMSRLETRMEDTLVVTPQMCGFPEGPAGFFRLTKSNNRIMLSGISSEITARFCHSKIQKSTLLLDGDFTLQIVYKGMRAEICVILCGTNEADKNEKQIEKLRTTQKLPFCTPTVCAYPFSAGALGILEAHDCGREWMASHYLLPWCRNDFGIVPYWTDFKYGLEEKISEWCPLLDIEVLSRESVKKEYRSPIDAFRHFISQNKYAYVSYNAYYVDEFWERVEDRFPYKHQCIVLGYDDRRGRMLIADFFRGRFKVVEVEYESFLLAYETYDHPNNMPRKEIAQNQTDATYVGELGIREQEYGHEIKLFSLTDAVPEMDYDLMSGLAGDFLEGTDTCIENECLAADGDKISFGRNFLTAIKKYVLETMRENAQVNPKPLYIMRCFDVAMKIRAKMLRIEDADFLEEIDEAYRCSSNLLNVAMRYNGTGRCSQAYVAERFDRLTTLEVGIVEKLGNILEATA